MISQKLFQLQRIVESGGLAPGFIAASAAGVDAGESARVCVLHTETVLTAPGEEAIGPDQQEPSLRAAQ